MKAHTVISSVNQNGIAFNTGPLPELNIPLEQAELSGLLLQNFSPEALVTAYFEFLLTRFDINELKLCYNNDYIFRSSGKRSIFGETMNVSYGDDLGLNSYATVSYGFLITISDQSKHRLSELHGTFATVLRHALAYNSLLEYSTKDPLTGLRNRKSFEDHLGKFLSQTKRTEQPLGLVLITLDVFKQRIAGLNYPDHHLVMQSFAQLLCNLLRQGDFAFRYDDNQFCCLIDAANNDTMQRIVERISLNLASHALLSKFGVWCSFGFTISDPTNVTQSPEDVLEQAQLMLNQRKRTANRIS